jgi:transposase
MLTLSEIRGKYLQLSSYLDECSRRIWAATEAAALGYGGATLVSNATGISRVTISKGLAEMRSAPSAPLDRIRKPGGGRKLSVHPMPTLPEKLEALVEPLTRRDPESPLRWTCKSTRRLTEELAGVGICVGRQTVTRQLHELGYSLQANRKTEEGREHPDRNAQFEHINQQATGEMRCGNPVISVDTKKRELVGNYKNNGCKWHRKGEATKVQGYDFPDPDIPRAFPYGIYDLSRNEGFVNVGSDHDTSQFAVASIRAW